MKDLRVTIHTPARGTQPSAFQGRWRSSVRRAAQGHLAAAIEELDPPGRYHEPGTTETLIRGAPDGLTPQEGGIILSQALALKIGIGFDAARGIEWSELVSKLDAAGFDPVAPSLDRPQGRKGIGSLFGVRGKE